MQLRRRGQLLASSLPEDVSCSKLYPDDQVESLRIKFYYEVAVQWEDASNLAAFLMNVLPNLEAGLLWASADYLSLKPCPNTPIFKPNTIIGVSSLQKDLPDTVGQRANCKYLPQQMFLDALCVPMIGYMSVEYLTGSDPDLMYHEFMAVLKEQMSLQRGLPPEIIETLFLGDGANYTGTFDFPTDLSSGTIDSSSSSDSSKVTATVTVVGAVAAVAVLLAALVLRRKPRVRNSAAGSVNQSTDQTQAPTCDKSESDAATHKIGNLTAVPVNTFESDDTSEAALVHQGELLEAPRPPPSTKRITTIEGGDLLEVMPPRVPSRRSSRTMKKKRRKKKRTKPTMHRVNSKERVNEMDVIVEDDEEEENEGVEDSDDSGSEYTWTDASEEASEEGQSSRDPSPSRARTPSWESLCGQTPVFGSSFAFAMSSDSSRTSNQRFVLGSAHDRPPRPPSPSFAVKTLDATPPRSMSTDLSPPPLLPPGPRSSP